MFRIAVCDDEKHFIGKLTDALLRYKEGSGACFEIDSYKSGKDLICQGIELVKYKIIFLDVNMDELDGIMTARKIREFSREIFIVFVTAYVEYTMEGYKVDAVRYVLKDTDNFQETIDECMDAIMDKMDYVIVKKNFSFNEGEKTISLDNLLYVESALHRLHFHIFEEIGMIYTTYGTLNTAEEKLKEGNFIRIHQSYLVNLRQVIDVTRYKVKLSNGEELPVSKARYMKVKNVFITYKGEI